MKRRQWFFVGAIIGSSIVALPSGLYGQKHNSGANEESQMLKAIENLTTEKKYQGTFDCRQCHSGGVNNDKDRQSGMESRVCKTEYRFWDEADHHAEAYKNLDEPRGQLIGKRLANAFGPKYANLKDEKAGCIQCHTTSLAAQQWAAEGVGCEACHGPSSNWKLHDKHDEWLKVALDGPEGRTARGWIDLRSARTRAEVCASCHIGNVQLKRVITHDMYAAGHPPLTGFELETFADKMPRHWRYSRENQKAGDSMFARTRNTLVAAVVAMRMSAELTKADAIAAQAGSPPELARLDCFACHHDLQAAGIRTVDPGAPGRPPIMVGCLPLVRVAAIVVGKSSADKLTAQLRQMKTPFEKSPFGNPGEIALQCDPLIEWCRDVESRLASEDFKFTSQSVRTILRLLGEQAAADDLDCDTARQLIAAWLVCYRELRATDPQGLSPQQRRDIESQFTKDGDKWRQFADAVPYAPKSGENPPPKADYQKLLERHFSDRPDFNRQEFNALMRELASIVARNDNR